MTLMHSICDTANVNFTETKLTECACKLHKIAECKCSLEKQEFDIISVRAHYIVFPSGHKQQISCLWLSLWDLRQ